MQTLPITAAKTRLNELVDETVNTHEHVTITKNGVPAAVLMSAAEFDSIQETLFWFSQEGALEDVAAADVELAAGQTLGEAEVRARLRRAPR